MRFLTEDPWERLSQIRERVPNLLLQMLLRGSNAVGYANYPDNVVRFFVREAANAGIDLFRVFDCLNWVENMRVSMDAVRDAGKLCEGAICYTGDILDPARAKYSLRYYVALAKELESAGAHIIGIKDMAGLLKPAAARKLVATLREEVGLPIHFHTHDTSGVSAASVLAAVEAGADAIDAAIDSLSGLTSQPCLGSLVLALKGTERDTGLDPEAIRKISFYFEAVRAQYRAFESDLRFGASEVYLHEMPGGQFTNLKEQARSLGLEARWHEVAQAYADVNRLFGDIVKVTPSSKVVGDLALMMVASGLTPRDVADPLKDVAFPESVVQMMRGDLGQPPGGWPPALQKKVLKGETPITARPGSLIPPADLDAARKELAEKAGFAPTDQELASYLMYPKVFTDFVRAAETYGPAVRPADAGLFLRPRRRRGDPDRARARQDAGGAHAGDRRHRRGRLHPRLLRAERPAAHGQGPQPLGQAGRGAAEGRGGQPQPRRRADARRRLDHRRHRRPDGRRRRRPAHHRSHEDGNRHPRRTRRQDRRAARPCRRPGRREGSADRVRGVRIADGV